MTHSTMRYIIIALLLSANLNSSAQRLNLSGNLSGLTADTKVILSDMMSKKFHDTATVSNNKFDISCTLPGAGLYVLRVGLIGKKPESRVFYLDAGNVRLAGERGSLKKAELSGDEPYLKDWLLFDKIVKNDPVLQLQKRQDDTVIMLTGKTGSYDGLMSDTGFVNRSMRTYPLVDAKKIELAKSWLLQHPESEINAYIIYKYLQREMDPAELKRAVDNLVPKAKDSLVGKALIAGGY